MYTNQNMVNRMKDFKINKKIYLVLLFIFTNFLVVKADVQLSGFKVLPVYLVSGKLNVANPNVITPFKFQVSLSRKLLSTGGNEDGSCTITLMYAVCSSCTNPLYQEISTPRAVIEADYKDSFGHPSGFSNLTLDAELPANITKGVLIIKFTYYNRDQQKMVTEYMSSNSIGIYYNEPPVLVADLVSYPSPSQFEIGVKLPNEDLEFKWNNSKLTSSLVNIALYDASSNLIVEKTNVPNNGSFSFDFSAVQFDNTNNSNRFTLSIFSALMAGQAYGSKYYIRIKEVFGTKYGKSGLFCFVNDHPMLWQSDLPNAFPNAFWIFRPDSSGSGYGELIVDWLVNRINASNVSIDLYDDQGNFFKRLANSVPNNGHFIRPSDDTIPRGNPYFYQFKITSVENPSSFGYSEVFHHWFD